MIFYAFLSIIQGTFDTVRYRVVGDGAATVFFSVHERDGIVIVAQDLSTGSETFYTVSRVCCEGLTIKSVCLLSKSIYNVGIVTVELDPNTGSETYYTVSRDLAP